MVRGIVALGFAALVTVGIPVATADVVVDTGDVTATSDAGVVTAKFTVSNTAATAVTITPTADPPQCLVTPTPVRLGARSTSSVTLTLADCFTSARTTVLVDVDGAGGADPVKVTGPDTESDWTPLVIAVFVALALAAWVARDALDDHERARIEATSSAALAKREIAYSSVQRIVNVRMDGLDQGGLSWTPLEPPTYGLRDTIGNLDAGWSFKDSWVANVTVASTALIALLTSADALTAVLGDKPAAALGVMTTAGLVSATLIGVANTALKLVGGKVSEVTVGGLVLASAIVVFAAALQVVTVAFSVALSAGVGLVAIVGVVVLAVAVLVVLTVYAVRSLDQTIGGGFEDRVPTVPDTALTDWSAAQPWEQRVVAARLRSYYKDWLEPAGPGEPSLGAGGRGEPAVTDLVDWTTTAPPRTQGRRAALL